jgi:hypothetical protein
MDGIGGSCGTYGEEGKYIQGFGEETWRGKRLLVIPRRRWKDNIKTDLQEVERHGMDCVHMAQDRNTWRSPVHVVINHLVP